MIRACWIGNWRIWGNFPFYRLEFSSKHHLLNRNKHFISPCWASYVANHIPVICPAGLLRSTNSILMNLSLHAQRKVTKRKGTVRVKDIGNKRVQGHGLHFYRDIRYGFTLDVSFIKASKCDRPEIHLPDPIIDLFQPNQLTFEQM